MTIKSGSHSIGPENGKLTISTYVGGMGSKAGHDLVLEATRWQGTASIDADNPSACSVQVSVDPRSLEVIQASGGLKGLSDKDRTEIAANQDKTLQTGKHPEITFQSTAVKGTAPRLTLEGRLTIAGKTQPVSLALSVQDGAGDVRVTGETTLVQSDFGVKPYSKMGVLKVKDPVGFKIELTLPSA